jgi:hypothetical protein
MHVWSIIRNIDNSQVYKGIRVLVISPLYYYRNLEFEKTSFSSSIS